MNISSILFVNGIINIILVIFTLLFVFIVLRVMLVLGTNDTKKSMMFPILIAGILMLPMAGTELFRHSTSPFTATMLAIFHSITMLLVVLTLTFGMYSYYRMLKKSFAWETESPKH